MLEWLLQRLTGAFLLFFLGAHLWALHLAEDGRDIDFQKAAQRLDGPFFQIIYIVLIGLVLYHGLYGLRGIIFDLVTKPGKRIAITWGFTLLGLLAFLVAIRSVMIFMGG